MVYHYCNLDTFLKIIQNKSLRLSDLGKSNDYTELIYMENIIREEFEKKIRVMVPEGEERSKVLSLEKFTRNIMLDSINLYAACFSEEKDLLSSGGDMQMEEWELQLVFRKRLCN